MIDYSNDPAYLAWRAELLKPVDAQPYDVLAYVEDVKARRHEISAEGERNAVKAALRKQAIIKARKGF